MGLQKKGSFRQTVFVTQLPQIVPKMAFLFNAKAWQGLKLFFDYDCPFCIMFSHILWYEKVRNFLSFLKLYSMSLLYYWILLQVLHFQTIFPIDWNNDVILFPLWDSASFVQQFMHYSTKTSNQTDYSHNNR